jgi:hypothetical protein
LEAFTNIAKTESKPPSLSIAWEIATTLATILRGSIQAGSLFKGRKQQIHHKLSFGLPDQ